MKTMIYKGYELSDQTLQKHIKEVFHKGGLVVFPTETVYGIGADATNPEAVKQIFKAKGRPSDNPLIVHISKNSDLELYVRDIPLIAKPLMDAFWPGPLTLVFNKKDIIPNEVTGGLSTVGIRIPGLKIARDIIDIAGLPICAPSANLSGKPSSTIFDHVASDFEERVDIIIDGGKAEIGIESTVLDITTPIPVMLRPGAVTKKMIENVLGYKIIDSTETKIEDTPKSPGMKYTHYAPKGKMTLVDGNEKEVIQYINQEIKKHKKEKTAVIGASEYLDQIDADYKVNLGHLNDLNEIASNIFIALRQMDELGIHYIYMHTLSNQDIGQAIMNRLSKAAGYKIVKL
ncbi:MAG: L-threonylcarbamoyladenylate synthase [Acholeplasmataceae bacterium]|nr:L-threonylcarbamoyladenylate synthase [Acholeplasmataceae bacterium]